MKSFHDQLRCTEGQLPGPAIRERQPIASLAACELDWITGMLQENVILIFSFSPDSIKILQAVVRWVNISHFKWDWEIRQP
jgi:hypothetical protein